MSHKLSSIWHSIWQSAGRPSHGGLKDFMSKTRNQYHYAIRRIKQMSNAIRAQNLLKASERGTVDLLKEMKTIKGSKKSSCNLPDNVAGVSGEQLIVEEFCSVYSAL